MTEENKVKPFREILEELREPLAMEDIELRVGANSQNSFLLLVYKTARTDMKRLNDVCPLWENEHPVDSKGNVTCTIRIWDYETEQWISRQDTGKESKEDKEKGAYSDSFKRAGFRWGIGIETYHAPVIRIPWDMDEQTFGNKKKYTPKKFWPSNLELTKWEVVNGIPELEIKYAGKVIFPVSMQKGKKSHSSETDPDRKVNTEEIKYLRDALTVKGLDDNYIIEQFDIEKLEDLLEKYGKDALQKINDFEFDDVPF